MVSWSSGSLFRCGQCLLGVDLGGGAGGAWLCSCMVVCVLGGVSGCGCTMWGVEWIMGHMWVGGYAVWSAVWSVISKGRDVGMLQ